MNDDLTDVIDEQEELLDSLQGIVKRKKSGNTTDPDAPDYTKPYLDENGDILETPNDLGSVLSVLDFITEYAVARNNAELIKLSNALKTQWHSVFEITPGDKLKLPYNRKSYYTILEYLKLQAKQLSNGEWDDFTDTDIGTIFLKLMSFLADIENYNVDKSVSELYLSTCKERSSAMLLCKLVGYKPRHYMSASTNIVLGPTTYLDNAGQYVFNVIPNGTVFPAGSTFVNNTGYTYTTLDNFVFTDNYCNVKTYEGIFQTVTFGLSDVDDFGRIKLPNYNIAFNTLRLYINGEEYTQVENVNVNTGELSFSVYCNEDMEIIAQLPAFWGDILTDTSIIKFTYLLCNGINGRVGAGKIVSYTSIVTSPNIRIASNTNSVGGYDPETVEEIKIHAPIFAKTMNTIVTLKDFEDVGILVNGISDLKALDYNDESSGLIPPTLGEGGYVNDAYKVNIYVLPDCNDYDEENPENNYYRNTIIKNRNDWEWSDLDFVAEEEIDVLPVNVENNQIVLEGYASVYTDVNDIILGVNTGRNDTSYLPLYVSTEEELEQQTVLSYYISSTDENIIIHLIDNWRTMIPYPDYIFSVFFKQSQILTEAGQNLREEIQSKKLSSLSITYYDTNIINPNIEIKVYMDSNNIEFDNTATNVKEYILNAYSRNNKLKIGTPIYRSVIGADIIDNFDYIRYCTVNLYNEQGVSVDKISPPSNTFLDIIPPNVTVTTYDYITQEDNIPLENEESEE